MIYVAQNSTGIGNGGMGKGINPTEIDLGNNINLLFHVFIFFSVSHICWIMVMAILAHLLFAILDFAACIVSSLFFCSTFLLFPEILKFNYGWNVFYVISECLLLYD